ncbi:MAG: hypothetical protein FIA97_07915, partial [Methylococcaceae bacterium]|nr:hypothetical protein [Methylococcaceae bacterium]
MKIFKCTIWLFLVAPGSVASATQQDIDNARIGGLAYLIAKQGGGGNWKSGDGTSVQTTALVIDAFRNSGITRGEAYGAAAAWLGNSDPVSVDGLARKIIALQAVGRNVEGHVGKLIGWGNSNDRYTWGTYKNYDTGILDTALALSAL